MRQRASPRGLPAVRVDGSGQAIGGPSDRIGFPIQPLLSPLAKDRPVAGPGVSLKVGLQ